MLQSSGLIGANVDQIDTGTTTDGQNALFSLGTRVRGPGGDEFIYVQAGEAISTTANEPFAVAIDENYQALKMTTALAVQRHRLGVAPRIAIPDNSFFWARVAGSNFSIRVAASAAADTPLRTTTTAGRLGTASTASAVVFAGAVIVTAASASTSAGNTIRTVLLTNPVPVRQGAVIG